MGGKYKLVLAIQYLWQRLPNFVSGRPPRLKGMDQVAIQMGNFVNGMVVYSFKSDVGGFGWRIPVAYHPSCKGCRYSQSLFSVLI